MKLLLPSGEGWDEGENIKCSVRCAHDSKATCGSPHRGRVSFFARAKKETKESTSRMARKPHCASRRNRRSPNSPGAQYAPRAQTRGSLSPIPAAMLGRAIRGFENTAPIFLGVESIQLNINILMKKFKDIWFHLKRRLWPIVPSDLDFIKWCATARPDNVNTKFTSSDGGNGNPLSSQQSTAFIEGIAKVLNTSDDSNSTVDININYGLSSPCSIAARSLSSKHTIRQFVIHERITEPLILDSLCISDLHLTGGSVKKVIIENSRIATLQISGPHSELDIRDTYIGKLVIHPGCLKRCNMHGGGISQLDIQPPGSDNPFTGSIWFANTWFPTEKDMPQGAQPYRNMRHHLRSLSNMQMADFFHALELRTERRQETWTNKAISYIYDLFSDFGASILRPILWLLLLGVSVSYILITWDGAIPTHTLESSAVGWQTTLLGDDIAAPISRGFYLSFYSIIHPLGLFGGQPVLVASTQWLSGLLIVEGIFAATLIALTIFALRRRFKLQQN